MLFTEPMKKIELLMLKSDADSVMRSLGFAGCVQLIAEGHEGSDLPPEAKEAAELRLRLQSLARFLQLNDEPPSTAGSAAPDRVLLARRASVLLEDARPLIEEETGLLQHRLELKQAADELGAFSRVKVPLEDVRGLSYLTVRFGSVSPDILPGTCRGPREAGPRASPGKARFFHGARAEKGTVGAGLGALPAGVPSRPAAGGQERRPSGHACRNSRRARVRRDCAGRAFIAEVRSQQETGCGDRRPARGPRPERHY